MQNQDEPKAPPPGTVIDAPHAPEVFATDAIGFFVNDGVVRITFASARASHVSNPAPINLVVIGRLAMPTRTAQALAVGLYDFLKKQGLDPTSPPPKEAMN